MLKVLHGNLTLTQYFGKAGETFVPGEVVELVSNTEVTAAKTGKSAYGIVESVVATTNNHYITSNNVYVYSCDITFQTDQYIDSPDLVAGCDLTIDDGFWCAARARDTICGFLAFAPTSSILPTIESLFTKWTVNSIQGFNNSTIPIQGALNFNQPLGININKDYSTSFAYEKEVIKVGDHGGAICAECNAENEYVVPVRGYVCRSCKSYRDM